MERRQDQATRDRLARIAANYDRFSRRVYRILVVLVLAQLVSWGVNAFLNDRQNDQKASLSEVRAINARLERTDCKLKVFLISARNTRATTANTTKDAQTKATATRAVFAYDAIISTFSETAHCKEPKLVALKTQKK